MARKKSSITKKLITVIVILIVIQGLFLFFFSRKQKTHDFKQTLKNKVNADDKIASEKKALLKVQLALSDYRSKNGSYPDTLDQLKGDYFDAIPLNPETAAPFQYSREGEHYSLEELAETSSGTAKKKGRRRGKGKATDTPESEEAALIASLDNDTEAMAFVYDSAGKKDPFRSHDFSPKEASAGGNTPLEQFTYDQLKLTAVLKGAGEPKALIEDGEGKGHTVTKGMTLGIYGGKVMQIEDNKVTILETTVEFTGEKKTRTVELYLRTGRER